MTRASRRWGLALVLASMGWMAAGARAAPLLTGRAAAPADARSGPLLLALGTDGEPTPPPSAGRTEPDVPEAPREGGTVPGEPRAPLARGEPQPPPAPAPAGSRRETAAQYGLGVQLRATFVPSWMLNLFLDASTSLYAAGFGIEGVRRKDELDIIASLDFAFYSPPDGNYLGNGEDPALKTDYVHFDGLNALTLAMHFVRHEELLPWLSFVWGGGVGLSLVLGDLYRASSAGCTADNVGDLEQCRPAGMDPARPERWINDPANRGLKADDSVASPKLFREEAVPPVLPLVHVLAGLGFKLSEAFAVRVDGGFRNALYLGTAAHYFF